MEAASGLTGASNSGSRNLTRLRLVSLAVAGSFGSSCILCLAPPIGPFADEFLTPIPELLVPLGTELELLLVPARPFSLERLSLSLFLVPVAVRRGFAPPADVVNFKGGSVGRKTED